MPDARRVCVFTGTRADYGLLRWLLRDLADDPRVELQLLVSGSHLSAAHGATVDEIVADGFAIDAAVDMQLATDTRVGTLKSMGLGLIGMSDALDRLRPDVLVVLGDRYEAFVAAQCALLLGVPLAHVHGGESTEGAVDEAIRHAITKMASLHFPAAPEFGRRIVQLGEDPARVHVVGAPGLDTLDRVALPGRAALEAHLDLPFRPPLLLVTYHPVTAAGTEGDCGVEPLLAALDRVPEATVVATMPNADPDRDRVAAAVRAWAGANADRARAATSLGQVRYLALLREADAVVGNSSSGLIEAPAVRTPTVNVGPRQDGRPRAGSVVDCAATADEIAAAIGVVLSARFRAGLPAVTSPYGHGGASARIAAVLATADLAGTIRKRFVDLPVPQEVGT